MHRRLPALLLAALSVASAGVAVLLSSHVFPYLSINNDEAINRLFADAIAHGDLFPRTMGLPDAFRPWLAVVSDDHYVLKYTPVVPAMIAVSQVLTNGTSLYLAVLAASAVTMTYLLGLEVLRDQAEATVAAALLAVSPLVLIHSAVLLSYLPTLVLLEGFAWSLLRGLRRDSGRLLALGGLLLGLAFVARSYDTLVFAAPLLLWAFFVPLRRRVSLRRAAAFLLPVAAAIGGFLAFNRAATGSLLRPPFALLERQDGLGFGVRRLYPTDPPHSFGLWEGVTGAVRHAALLNFWVAGGSILLVLAVVTVLRGRLDGPAWPLASLGVLVPASYVIFWGPWNATVLWGGTRYLGPFYFLLVLVPLVLLGARGLVDGFRWRPAAGVAVATVMAAVTAALLVPVVRDNLAFTRNSAALHRLVASRPSPGLVFADMPTPFLMHPPAVLGNNSNLSGRVVFAVEQGNADLDAVRLMETRAPYRLQFRGAFRRPAEKFGARLEELRWVRGDAIELAVHVDPVPAPGTVTLAVSGWGVTREYSLGSGRGPYDERLIVDREGAVVVGRSLLTQRHDASRTGLEVELVMAEPGGRAPMIAGRARMPMRVAGPVLEALVPTGASWITGSMDQPLLKLSG